MTFSALLNILKGFSQDQTEDNVINNMQETY